MLKKLLFSISMIALFAITTSAQSIAIVDIAKILEKSPEYSAAQLELNKVAATWRQEIAQAQDGIKSLYNKFQAEQVLLSDEMKTAREDEIMKKEKEVRDLNRAKFGPEGELFRKRQQLVAPVQDKIYTVIQDYAEDRAIDIMLDKSSSAGIIFASDKYDKTDDIIRRLGY